MATPKTARIQALREINERVSANEAVSQMFSGLKGRPGIAEELRREVVEVLCALNYGTTEQVKEHALQAATMATLLFVHVSSQEG